MADDPVLLNLAEAILDGRPIDWPTLTTGASASQREVFHQLRALAAIGSLSRRAPILPSFHSDPLPAGATWGPLTLLEPIGHGAFGVVYRAWDPKLDREVALKLLPAAESALNTLDEGRLLAKVHHPSVVTIFGADRIGSFVGLWMELVRGQTLEQVLTKSGTFTPAQTIDVGRQLCSALAAVHGAGLVHRDVKAHNVMMTPTGRVVLMDFGSGRFRAGPDDAMAGTPLYLAPEIFEGGPATERSDIYSAGVLLYHLLTGGYPVEGRSLGDIREARHKMPAAPDLRATRPDVPRGLAFAIRCALDPQPSARFHSADAFRDAIEPHASASRRYAERAVLALIAAGAIAGLVVGGRSLRNRNSGEGDPPVTSSLAIAAAGAPSTRRFSLPDDALAGSGMSYDGRFFSFINNLDDLGITNLWSGETETLVPDEGEEFPEFSITSPNGDRVAYQWMTARRSYELRVVDRTTKAVRTLLRDDTLDYPLPIQWSQDGSAILLWSKTLEGGGRIARVDAHTGHLDILRDIPVGEPLGLSWSPDGRYVAYDLPESAAHRARGLHILDVSNHQDRQVARPDEANDRFPLWTPDGNHLFFISDRSGSPDGWLMPVHDGAPGGEPALIVRNLGRVTSLGLTAAGTFYYRLEAGVFEVNQITLEPHSTEFLTPPAPVARRFAASNIGPSYSPDGKRLAYISVREGLGGRPARTIVVTDLASGEETELSSDLDVGNAPQRWSPDGLQLLGFSVDRAGRRATRIIDARSGALLHEFNVQADREMGDYGAIRWSADGKSVLYEHVHQGLMKHTFDGRPDTVVYPYTSASLLQRVHRFDVSPDGNLMAASGTSRDGDATVLHVIAPGGEIELARRDFPEMLTVQGWLPDSQSILFTTLNAKQPPPHDLWRIGIRGEAPRRLGALPSATQINPVAIHPNGSAVAFTAGTPLRELWRMDHFLPD